MAKEINGYYLKDNLIHFDGKPTKMSGGKQVYENKFITVDEFKELLNGKTIQPKSSIQPNYTTQKTAIQPKSKGKRGRKAGFSLTIEQRNNISKSKSIGTYYIDGKPFYSLKQAADAHNVTRMTIKYWIDHKLYNSKFIAQ